MTLELTLLVLLSAILHAGWNTLLKKGGDRFLSLVSMAVVHMVPCLLMIPFVPLPDAATAQWLAMSLVFNVAYQIFLSWAYKHGDLSQVYPIARGSGPLWVALTAPLFYGTVMPWYAQGAVALICTGLFTLGIRRGMLKPENLRPLLLALATGMLIASYLMTDAAGVRAAPVVWTFIAWQGFTLGSTMMVVAICVHKRGWQKYVRQNWRRDVVRGLMGFVSYGIILYVLRSGPVAEVVALRETSVIFAAVLGWLFLGEGFGKRRIAGAIFVASGVLLLKLGALL
ncbi:MAG: EamA family transporter [Proteobacteria bacterium]|nr:EamA family transporter [Pseudomonadota bacterium]